MLAWMTASTGQCRNARQYVNTSCYCFFFIRRHAHFSDEAHTTSKISRNNIIYLILIPGSVYYAGVPGGLVGGPCAYQDQFRGFKSHRVHALGFFLQKRKWVAESARA